METLYVKLVEFGLLKHGNKTGSNANISDDIKNGKKPLTSFQEEKFDDAVNNVIEHLEKRKGEGSKEIFNLSNLSAIANDKSREERTSLFEEVCGYKDKGDLWKEIANDLTDRGDETAEEKAERERREQEEEENRKKEGEDKREQEEEKKREREEEEKREKEEEEKKEEEKGGKKEEEEKKEEEKGGKKEEEEKKEEEKGGKKEEEEKKEEEKGGKKEEEEKKEEEKGEKKEEEEEEEKKGGKKEEEKGKKKEEEGKRRENSNKPVSSPPNRVFIGDKDERRSLYSKISEDAKDYWPKGLAKQGSVTLLFEKKTRLENKHGTVSYYGIQTEAVDIENGNQIIYQYEMVTARKLPAGLLEKWEQCERPDTPGRLIFDAHTRKFPNELGPLDFVFMFFPKQVKAAKGDAKHRKPETEVIVHFEKSQNTVYPVLLSTLEQRYPEIYLVIRTIAKRDGMPEPKDWLPEGTTTRNKSAHNYTDKGDDYSSVNEKIMAIDSAPIPRVSTTPETTGDLREVRHITRTSPVPGRHTQSPSPVDMWGSRASPSFSPNADQYNAILKKLEDHDKQLADLSGLATVVASMDGRLSKLVEMLKK